MSAARSSLLSFHLGPVQAFVAAAKTTRDLWAGSYILSWLTAAAMKPLLERDDTEVIAPHVYGNPLLAAALRDTPAGRRIGTPVGDRLLACLPNRVLARVPRDHATELAAAVETACRDEWKRISDAVFQQLDRQLRGHEHWGHLWTDQLNHHFEVRVIHIPAYDADRGTPGEYEDVGKWAAAARSVRHVPSYAPDANADVPQKCTLLGTYEQMGPPRLEDSRHFWNEATKATRTRGAAVRKGERLCAVSLVKRFAWPHYFAPKLRQGVPAEEFLSQLRFADTATAAAREWLALGSGLPWEEWQKEGVRWSGQWLHWRTPHQDEDEDRCPDHVWDAIQRHKRAHGPPPGYYALLSLDADRLGEHWKTDPANVGEALARFALRSVGTVVERDHFGELVYTGGDNTLAVVPAGRAVQLAHALNGRFTAEVPGGCTLSGGVVVAHYKEDLRFALDEARRAERLAKTAGRNRLVLAVCRRSGEHSVTNFPWAVAPALDALVGLFRDGATDRWAYKLREELPTLRELPEVFRAELTRLIERTDAAELLKPVVGRLFDLFRGDRNRRADKVAEPFVTLCQSASFLARGGDR